MHILVGHDAIVAAWVGDRLGGRVIGPQRAFGIIDGRGVLRGGFVIRALNEVTCDLTLYSNGVMTNGVMRVLWRIVFHEFGFCRCVIHTAKTNKAMKRAAPKLGFRFEGTAWNFYGDGVHALTFSMTPNTCRWLSHGNNRRQFQKNRRATQNTLENHDRKRPKASFKKLRLFAAVFCRNCDKRNTQKAHK